MKSTQKIYEFFESGPKVSRTQVSSKVFSELCEVFLFEYTYIIMLFYKVFLLVSIYIHIQSWIQAPTLHPSITEQVHFELELIGNARTNYLCLVWQVLDFS